MKIKAELAGNEHTVTLETAGAGFSGQVDDRRYEFEIRDLGSGDYLIQHGSFIHRYRVEADRELNEMIVHLRDNSYVLAVRDPRRLRRAQDNTAYGQGSASIVAAMPGKLVRVLVEVGARVEAGTGLLVVEAMKMQNELKAPIAGTVVSLRTDAGATVNAGDVLAVVE